MQPKYRNLLTGAAVKGFNLNERGMEKARELIAIFGIPETGLGQPLGSLKRSDPDLRRPRLARSIEPDREVARIKSSKLFQKWKQGVMTDRDLIHVHALLGIFDHTPTPVRIRSMKELEDAANKIEDADALQFLTEIRKTFPQALSR
jgi:hypothetical protein